MKYTWIRVTNDQVVSPNPCLIGAVIVSPDSSSNVADATLYDGESTGDKALLKVYTGTGATKVINFTPYLVTHRGLYVDVGSNVTEVLVQLVTLPE